MGRTVLTVRLPPVYGSAKPAADKTQEEVKGAPGLILVDRIGGVDLLGTDLGAVADRGATPGAVSGVDEVHAPRLPAIARIAVVALQQRHRAGPMKSGFSPNCGQAA